MLENAIFLVLASLILGFAWFAVCYWLLGWSYKEAMSDARLIITTCLIVELFRPWIEKKFAKKKQSGKV